MKDKPILLLMLIEVRFNLPRHLFTSEPEATKNIEPINRSVKVSKVAFSEAIVNGMKMALTQRAMLIERSIDWMATSLLTLGGWP
ncbi:MAG: hypothetical protein AOA65_0538 [Candidatus Bathyarchaeota archaeon BA1]|nr:MAG: hypothetical protein AOA65_0538 [Candidatus Bathyarchaeota archaeon BA1]